MTKIFPLLLCLSAICFAGETWNGHQCYEFLKIAFDMSKKGRSEKDYQFVLDAIFSGEKTLKEPESMREPNKEAEYCHCHETAICYDGKMNFCTSYKCADGKIIYLESYRSANTGGGGSSSGSSGQPKGTK